MLEFEGRFEVQGRPVLLVGWFEGSGTGRIVVAGPNKLREEIQVSVDSSLLDEIQAAMAEPPPAQRLTPVKVHLTLMTSQGRATRTMELGGGTTRLDLLCMKLLTMAEAMVKGDALKKIVGVLRARC